MQIFSKFTSKRILAFPYDFTPAPGDAHPRKFSTSQQRQWGWDVPVVPMAPKGFHVLVHVGHQRSCSNVIWEAEYIQVYFFAGMKNITNAPIAPTVFAAPSHTPSEVKVATAQSGMLRQTAKHSMRLLNISHEKKGTRKKSNRLKYVPHIAIFPSRPPAGGIKMHLSEQPKKQIDFLRIKGKYI